MSSQGLDEDEVQLQALGGDLQHEEEDEPIGKVFTAREVLCHHPDSVGSQRGNTG